MTSHPAPNAATPNGQTMSHTKGPWTLHTKLSGSENHRGWEVWGGYYIATVSPMMDAEGRGDPSGEGMANARLIAQAPALKAELQSLINEVRGILGAYGPELREVMGNTNMSCLAMRLEDSERALARATSADEHEAGAG